MSKPHNSPDLDPEMYPCPTHGIKAPIVCADGDTLCGLCLSEAIDELVTAQPLSEVREQLRAASPIARYKQAPEGLRRSILAYHYERGAASPPTQPLEKPRPR